MSDKVVVCAGTKRGLFLLESDKARSSWKISGPHLKGWQIYHAIVDTRSTPRLHAAAISNTFAATTASGDLASLKFEAAKKPPIPPKLLPGQAKFIKKWNLPSDPRIWHVEPGRASEKGVLYAGTAPAALFRTDDDGKTWTEVKGLSKHKTRNKWTPGAGGLCLHSIQLDPKNADRMWVGISSAGVFRTDDGGKSWKAANQGITGFEGHKVLKEGAIGTCVHKVLLHPGKPGRLYQQNHIGVYRSDNNGDTWDRIDKGLPYDFGFGLALNMSDPNTCYVAPLEPEGGMYRATPGKFAVYRLRANGSTSWEELSNGLPSEGAFISVLREGMSQDTLEPGGIYVGTGGGQVYHSSDAGASWRAIAMHLPPILSVSAAVV